jgi:hypothetical protein
LIYCTNCKWPLPAAAYNSHKLEACPSCGTQLQLDVFPAIMRERHTGEDGEPLLMDDQASCFYHPAKKAVIPCEACGRFLCGLCEITFNNAHLCPACLETGKSNNKYRELENHRILYDEIAWGLALYPLLIFWLTLFTAPVALFIAISKWNAPSSIVPRWLRFRFIAAIFLACLQLTGWSIFLYKILT